MSILRSHNFLKFNQRKSYRTISLFSETFLLLSMKSLEGRRKFDIIEMFYGFDKTRSSIRELINWLAFGFQFSVLKKVAILESFTDTVQEILYMCYKERKIEPLKSWVAFLLIKKTLNINNTIYLSCSKSLSEKGLRIPGMSATCFPLKSSE